MLDWSNNEDFEGLRILLHDQQSALTESKPSFTGTGIGRMMVAALVRLARTLLCWMGATMGTSSGCASSSMTSVTVRWLTVYHLAHGQPTGRLIGL